MKTAEFMAAIKDRRKHRKVVYVGEDMIRRLLQMPDDVVLERIDYDMVRQSFVLICNHPDWPKVEDYCEPPAIIGTTTPVKIKGKTLHEKVDVDVILMKLDLNWKDDDDIHNQ